MALFAMYLAALFAGCGNSSISSASSRSASFEPFKDEINKRFRTAYGSRDQYFSKDFDVSIELLETAPVRAVQNGEFGSPQDMLSLRKSFYDLIGEIQNLLDILWSDRKSFVRRITPEWYRTVPIQVVNLVTASSLINRASEAKTDRDYSLFLHQAKVAITTPMVRPESPFDVFPLIALAKSKCAYGTLTDTQIEELHVVLDDSDLEACTADAFRSVSSLWVMTVVNAKIGLLPESLIQRLNWGIALIRHYGGYYAGINSPYKLLVVFLQSLRLYLVERPVISPEDRAYHNKLLMYMYHLDRVIDVPVECRDKSHIFCRMPEKFTDGLQLDPRGPIKELYPN
jgi:hypothetical protein